MKIISSLIIISTILLVSNLSQAQSSLYGGAGVFNQNINRVTTDSSGEKNFLGTMHPHLVLMGKFPVGAPWFVAPRFGMTVPGRSVSDGAGKVTLIHLATNLIHDLQWIDLQFGLRVLWQRFNGGGGNVEGVNNGNPATYFRPSRYSTARYFYLDVGCGFGLGTLFATDVRFDLDFVLPGVLSTRRTVNVMANISFGLL